MVSAVAVTACAKATTAISARLRVLPGVSLQGVIWLQLADLVAEWAHAVALTACVPAATVI